MNIATGILSFPNPGYTTEDVLGQKIAQAVLSRVLRQTMELLHPFMPFLTEEIWQALPHAEESIVIAKWPLPSEQLWFEEALSQMELIIEVVRAIRNIRAEAGVQPQKKVEAIILSPSGKRGALEQNSQYISNLAGLGNLRLLDEETAKPDQSISAIAGGVTIFVPIAGMIDVAREKERLSKEMNQLEEEITKLQTRIESPAFTSKAPPQVVEKEKTKLESFREKADKIKERLRQLG